MKEIMTRKPVGNIIVLGIGKCFAPYSDFNDNQEVLYMHESADNCSQCARYWKHLE